MPPEQLRQVLEAIPQLHIRKWKDNDVQMLFKICYWLALRIDEAFHLQAENFDFDINEVWLGKTKTEKSGVAQIPNNFRGELILYLEGKSGLLFPGMNYQTTIKWINRLGIMLDIKAWTTKQSDSGEKTKTHIFRKSIGKDMAYGEYGKKAPLTFISKTLRHGGKNPLAVTMKYLQVGGEEVKDWWSSTDVLTKDDKDSV